MTTAVIREGQAAASRSEQGRVNILGVQVGTSSLMQIASEIVRWAQASTDASAPRYVCATSVHGLIEGVHDTEFRAILNGAAAIIPDGMPLVWFGRLRGVRGMKRVCGAELLPEACRLTAGLRVRHFFYGGAEGVPETLAQRLAARYPGLRVAGTYSPPFRPQTPPELRENCERINASGADIVWVGLSTPKQERWIAVARPLLKARVVLSVGAAFDFHTGRVRRAPRWMQAAGLEWLFRLIAEPRRLWKRYAINVPTFLALAALQLMGWKRFDDR